MSNQTYQHAAAIMAGENPSFAASPPKLKSPTASSSFSRTEQFNPDTASPSSPTEVEMEPVRRGDRVVSMFHQRDGTVRPGDVGQVLKLGADGVITVQWPKRKGFAWLPSRRSNANQDQPKLDSDTGPIDAGLVLNNVATQLHKIGRPPKLPAELAVGSNVTSQVKKGWSDGDRVDVGDPGVVLGPSTRPRTRTLVRHFPAQFPPF